MPLTFVTGPVRSGKSTFAAQLARAGGMDVVFLGTAARDPNDAQWEARLERHARERPSTWTTIETAAMEPHALVEFLLAASPQQCVLLDALGTWLAARMGALIERIEADYANVEIQLGRDSETLAAALLAARCETIVVAEQTGWDVVPVAASARLFRDVLGRLTRRLAPRASRAYLVVAGLAIDLLAGAVRVEDGG